MGVVHVVLSNGLPGGFKNTAARWGVAPLWSNWASYGCFNTQPPEGGCVNIKCVSDVPMVSTHSRPKAAVRYSQAHPELIQFQHTAARRRLAISCWPKARGNCFNTQPPEGGCPLPPPCPAARRFQHTAARRRLVGNGGRSRNPLQFQHTAARRRLLDTLVVLTLVPVSTHSRPKAAGRMFNEPLAVFVFQHTAARRRLVHRCGQRPRKRGVSTHSRPKAAGD